MFDRKEKRDSMDEVFERYERLVYHIVKQYSFGKNEEDLKQAGMMGLKMGLLHCNRDQEDIVSYLCLYIKGEIIKELNKDKPLKVSRDMYQLGQNIKKAKEELSQEFGRYPSKEELAFYLNEDLLKIEQAELLQEPIYQMDLRENEEEFSLYDKVPYIETGYDASILDLNDAILSLEEEEQKLIYSRYYEDKTQREIAQTLGTSQVQVSREEKKILKKMENFCR